MSGRHPHEGAPGGAAPERRTPEAAASGGATPSGAAPWLAPGALVLAVLAAATLPGRPAGLGLALLGVGLCAVGAWGAGLADRWSVAWWLAAAALSAVAVLRSAAWVVVLALLGATALASLAAAGGAGWRDVVAGAFGVPRQLVPGAYEAGRRTALAAAPLAHGRGRALPALRGGLLAALLLAIFLPLFLAADAAFAELASDVVAVDLGVSQPVWRIVLAVLVLAIAGALWRLGAHRRARPTRAPRATLGRTEWRIAIATLDLLFAAFVLVQVTTLFGGDGHVLRTAGLTYAEYARQGFAQLEVVAALTLAVIAAAARWGPPGGDRLLRALLAVLCVLTLVVLASALKRLGLYEHAYGFTRLRFLVHAQLLWLGALFVALLAAGATRRTHGLPRATVALSAAAALLFAVADPDRWIAERNADRYERTGRIDVAYLEELSPDAAPVLDRLPANLAECLAESLRAQLDDADGIAGANHGRARARRALARVPADAACSSG